MKDTLKIGFVLIIGILLASCDKEEITDTAVVGHWGCERYVSCRTNDTTGVARWDTTLYEVGEGHGYEVFFYNDCTGQLLLNESPAFLKKFNCNYVYDEAASQIVIEAPGLLYAIYQSMLALSENRAEFNVETVNDSVLVASWTNAVSETSPFFERFFLKRID